MDYLKEAYHRIMADVRHYEALADALKDVRWSLVTPWVWPAAARKELLAKAAALRGACDIISELTHERDATEGPDDDLG